MAAIIITTMKDTEADTAMTTMDDGGNDDDDDVIWFVLFILSIEKKDEMFNHKIQPNRIYNFVFVLCLSANSGPIFYTPL